METQHQQCPGLTQGSIEEKQSKIPNMKETEKGRYWRKKKYWHKCWLDSFHIYVIMEGFERVTGIVGRE